MDAYDLDGFDTPKATVDRIHANGGKGICYISVGSWESWRPDKGRFPKRVLGRGYYGWPGEKWLDVRQLDALAPIMEARMDACKEKGFDAIVPDTTRTATRTGRASGSRTPSNSATTRSSQRPPTRGASRSP
ncbi:MAG TPA: endo alpha-1,4 polygalactosaminidase [Rubrobacter sp.]|nr:endo alpha-1,4 polygalactosaminidase [Rubrobacter sp.]